MRQFKVILSVASVVLCSLQAFAGDKSVQLETIPAGAQVEVNGSVTCITPCSIKVPGYYFGKKRTAFSSHGIEPIRGETHKKWLRAKNSRTHGRPNPLEEPVR